MFPPGVGKKEEPDSGVPPLPGAPDTPMAAGVPGSVSNVNAGNVSGNLNTMTPGNMASSVASSVVSHVVSQQQQHLSQQRVTPQHQHVTPGHQHANPHQHVTSQHQHVSPPQQHVPHLQQQQHVSPHSATHIPGPGYNSGSPTNGDTPLEQVNTPDMPVLEPQESFPPPHSITARSSTQNSPASTVSYSMSPHGQHSTRSPQGTQSFPSGHQTGSQSFQGIPPPLAHGESQFPLSTNQASSYNKGLAPGQIDTQSIEIEDEDDINPEMLDEVAPTFPRDFTPSAYKLPPRFNTGIMANSNPLKLSNLNFMEKQQINNPAIHGLDLTSQSLNLSSSNQSVDQTSNISGFASDKIVIKQEITDSDFEEACIFGKASQPPGDPDLEQLLIPERRGSGQ